MSSITNEENLQRPVTELKNIHHGEVIWVIASGASMDFVEPDFFANKITVGVNRVNRKFDCNYLVAKDAGGFEEIMQFRKRAQIVVSRHQFGDLEKPLNEFKHPHWVFDHPGKLDNQSPDLSAIGSDQLVVSYSTITSALHLAAYLGAHSIVVCGHDCGAINGAVSFESYYAKQSSLQGSDPAYYRWLGEVEQQSISVIRELRTVYGTFVHSLNPFLNFNLDGNTFESCNQEQSDGVMTSRLLELEQRESSEEIQQLKNVNHQLENVNRQLRLGHQQLESCRDMKIGASILRPIRWLRYHRFWSKDGSED
tara:strand:- start:1175 stop:2104 length:930 start_codon:yes stop_codon:yes gene_type:complete